VKTYRIVIVGLQEIYLLLQFQWVGPIVISFTQGNVLSPRRPETFKKIESSGGRIGYIDDVFSRMKKQSDPVWMRPGIFTADLPGTIS
jgi:hypothetical protein